MKTVAIASDHAGYEAKERIKKELGQIYDFEDLGTHSDESVDYPVYAKAVGEYVQQHPGTQGVLICGNGVGITMAANKIHGIRAALAYSKEVARQTRQHNNANILSLGGRSPMMDDPLEIARVFLETDFSAEERHQRRVDQIMELEK